MKKIIGKKIKTILKDISLKLWEKWEMNENFIEVLVMMDVKKIYKFNVVYRKGKLHYSIEESYNEFNIDSISKSDVDFIYKYFISAGYEVSNKYVDCSKIIKKMKNRNGFETERSLIGIYIKGRK